MSKQKVDSNDSNQQRDPDLAAAEIAMKRAAEKARQKANQVGAGVALWKDGQVVEERHNSTRESKADCRKLIAES